METKRLYLNGSWVEPEAPIDVINPANGQVIGRVATVDRRRVAQALPTRQRAWPAWNKLPARDRGGC